MPEWLSKPGAVDKWMKGKTTLSVSRGFIARLILKVLTFLPFIMIAPALFTGNGPVFNLGVADVLGTASEMLLIMCLAVTPLITLTGWRWIAPMRQWYGIMFGLSAVTDATIASITTTDFAGGPLARVTEHSFLLIGLTMVIILIPLILTANKKSQKLLGKYWKLTQRATYIVWALLLVHLTLLEGFGIPSGDGLAVLHQRLYQIVAVSVPLVLLRIPKVKKWAVSKRSSGGAWAVLAPVLLVGLVFFLFIGHEFWFKGIGLLELNPPTD